MTPLRQHMIAALQLSGKGERTQESYIREVRLLAQFYHKSPDRISEQDPRFHAHLLQRYPLLLSTRPQTRLGHPLAHARANRTPSPRRAEY